jgi:hypothetical protein
MQKDGSENSASGTQNSRVKLQSLTDLVERDNVAALDVFVVWL